MASRYPVSKLARAFGIIAIVDALIAVAVPLGIAFAMYRGLTSEVLSTPLIGLVGAAIALIGLILCVLGAIAGRGQQSATVIIGALMNAGVLLGLLLAVFLPMLTGA
ncbi:hypothetical protein [Microbacterium sp. SORGH_AS_0428]|uniref:hypothetical protein n=1 Tax=Microbacterium sp. SORGH_AS_0428 TaxID=3041788 RepID=UPI00286A1925|nr:hypothetical protein [Microbacterium sp. SORGH_AS_0428]